MVPMATIEKAHIEFVLGHFSGRKKVNDASKVLKIGRSTLYNKIKEYKIDIQ